MVVIQWYSFWINLYDFQKCFSDKVSGLDLTKYLSGPLKDSGPRSEPGCIINQNKKPIFDLYGCVCHFGSIHGGHYTSYAKHLATGQVNFKVVKISNSRLDIYGVMISYKFY